MSNKQAKLNWLHFRSQIDAGNLKDVRCGIGAHFRIPRRKYLKVKINPLDTNHSLLYLKTQSVPRRKHF